MTRPWCLIKQIQGRWVVVVISIPKLQHINNYCG